MGANVCRVSGHSWADVRALDVTPFGIAAVAGMLTALAAALCRGARLADEGDHLLCISPAWFRGLDGFIDAGLVAVWRTVGR
mgnify:CR=1 FL=1